MRLRPGSLLVRRLASHRSGLGGGIGRACSAWPLATEQGATAQEPVATAVGQEAQQRQDYGEGEGGAGSGQDYVDGADQAVPAGLEAADEAARRAVLLVLGGGGGDQEEGDGAEGGLVGQGALAGQQGLEAGLFGVDLVLHGEQAADRACVAQQAAQLADRRLG